MHIIAYIIYVILLNSQKWERNAAIKFVSIYYGGVEKDRYVMQVFSVKFVFNFVLVYT